LKEKVNNEFREKMGIERASTKQWPTNGQTNIIEKRGRRDEAIAI
jgi:hypothetical protein